MDVDWAFWGFLVTLASLIATVVFRKRIGRAIGRLILSGLVSHVKEAYFDPVETKDAEGKKRVLMRPNDRFGELIAVYGPLSAAYGMEWARRNIKLKLPSFELPEGSDLKALGASALAQKVLSGKKLSLEDGIPLAIGYVKDFLEKSGIIEKVTKGLSGVAGNKPAEAVTPNPFLKELPK
jgi:hypothetical protein